MSLEQKFTREEVDQAMYWADAANNLHDGRHEWNPTWASSIIEHLRPFSQPGNVAEMYVRELTTMYEERVRRPYAISTLPPAESAWA